MFVDIANGHVTDQKNIIIFASCMTSNIEK